MNDTVEPAVPHANLTAPQAEDESPYWLHSRIEILAVLRDIARSRTLANVNFGSGAEALVTPLLGVDIAAGELLFDCSGSERINRGILQAEKLLFYCMHDKIKIRFSTPAARVVQSQNRESFAACLPESMLRLQRRELYRIPAPISRPIRCTVPVQKDNKIQYVETRLHDISQGGVALIARPGELHVEPGMSFPDCRIALPDAGNAVVMLETVHVRDMPLLNGKTAVRIACKYVRPSTTALALIQRQMMKLERELKAKQ
jgi:flagellar brake protein